MTPVSTKAITGTHRTVSTVVGRFLAGALGGALAGAIAVTAGGYTVAETVVVSIDTARDSTRFEYTTAAVRLVYARSALTMVSENLDKVSATAAAALAASTDRTLTADVRPVLEETLATADWVRFDVTTAQIDTSRATRLIGDDSGWPWELDRLTEQLLAATAVAEHGTDLAAEVSENLIAAVAAVGTDVAAWEAEQARIAAAAAAAEAEARAAAARSGSRSDDSSGPAHFQVYVWGYVDSADGTYQAAVDAGGQVAIQYGPYTVVSAHNFNDATALALRVGDFVTFTGAVSGTWVVTGSSSVISGGSSEQLAAVGTSMMMMTCFWGSPNSRVVGLVAG